MIRYTSDPQTNLDILLKNINPIDMKYTDNIRVPESESVSGVIPTEPYIDVPFKSVLRLPSEDPFNKFQKGLNIGGKYVPNDNTNVPNDNITVPMQTKEMQINNIKKELDRLDKEEEKYNKERQAKRDYYNSDAFLSRVYQLDPNTAQFLAGRRDMQTKRELEETKIEVDKMPKDRSMTIDQIRQQLRIAQETAINKMNATLDPDLKEQYRKEMQIYVEEAAKDYPSIQDAAIAVRDLQTKTGGEDVNASEWWKNNKPTQDSVSKYGRNSDGSIKDKTKLIYDYKELARQKGYTSLDKTIENYIESLNTDMTTTTTTKKEDIDRQRQIGQESERIIIQKINEIYPKLRTEIMFANSMIRVISEGDAGNISARNEAVKQLSRLASDEALTNTDFGQALGRDGITSLLDGLTNRFANSKINITDEEWKSVKTRLVNAIDAVKSRRSAATEQIPGSEKYIERIITPGSTTKPAGTTKTTRKTVSANEFFR